jgi:hypothetical protein
MLYLAIIRDDEDGLYYVINEATTQKWSRGYKRRGNAENRMSALYGRYQQDSILDDEARKDKGLKFDSMGLMFCPDWPICLNHDFAGYSECSTCEGRGEVYVCPRCRGTAFLAVSSCYLCRRRGYVPWSVFKDTCPPAYEREWSTTSDYGTMTFSKWPRESLHRS